jgi:hypothetical protein
MEEGVFLMDDLIPQFGQVGELLIEDCQTGVYILDSRQAVGNKAGKQASNDAAYELARNYFAARLNEGAGACVVPAGITFETREGPAQTFAQVKDEAQAFLLGIGFDGSGSYLDPRSAKNGTAAEDRAYALYLAGILDDYNNAELCNGDPSH